MKKIFRTFLFIILIQHNYGADAWGAPPKKNLSVPCPNIIADQRDGTLRSNKAAASIFPFKCFNSPLDAKRSGFTSFKSLSTLNFSGWYRLRLSLVSDTCNANSSTGQPVLFLQIKDTGNAVFGEFCPTLDHYSGIRSDTGFTISGISEQSGDPAGAICSDGIIRKHQYIELQRVFGKAAAYTASYRQVITCPSSLSTTASCTREYRGIAFPETHKIWPPVSETVNDLSPQCATALNSCKECHAELANFPFKN